MSTSNSVIRSTIRRIGAGDGFDCKTDTVLNDWISDALEDVPTSKLGDRANRAVAYYTAHLMLQSTNTVSSTGGGVTKKKAGDVEIGYSAGGGGPDAVLMDKYYVKYQSILRAYCRFSPMVLDGNC